MSTAVREAPRLRAMQRWLASLIQDPERPDRLVEAAIRPSEMIEAPDRAWVEERLRVHTAGSPARIAEALVDAYPALAHLIGSAELAALSRRFLRAAAPTGWNLNRAGAGLAGFLRFDALAVRFPFACDLAELEWAVARAFHAFERPPLEAARLTSWSLEELDGARLILQPSVAVLWSAWPVRELWANRHRPIEEIDVDLSHRPDQVLVRRSGLGVGCESISAGEATALTDLLDGRRLGEVATRLAAHRHDPEAISRWFSRWMRDGLITECTTEGR